jgi:WD40 repeat protein
MVLGSLAPAPVPAFGDEPKERVALKAHTGQIDSLAFAPDGKTLASAGHDGTVRMFDLTTNTERAKLKRAPISRWRHVTFTPDGKTLAAAGGDDETDGGVILWDLATFQDRVIMLGNVRMSAVAFTKDSKRLAGVGENGVLKLWNAVSAEELALFKAGKQDHGDDICAVEFTADEKSLITGSWDTTARFWTIDAAKDVAAIEHDSAVWSLAVSKDHKTIAVGCAKGGIFQWDVATRKQRGNAMHHARRVVSLAYSHDGGTLASASKDRTWKLWNAVTGEEIAAIREPATAVVFSPDGATLAVGHQNGIIKLWDVPR